MRGAVEAVYGHQLRTVADVPIDDRRVVVRVRVRRLVCPTLGCRHTFREQVPGVLERYQRRTARLTRQVGAVVKELASIFRDWPSAPAGGLWVPGIMSPRLTCWFGSAQISGAASRFEAACWSW